MSKLRSALTRMRSPLWWLLTKLKLTTAARIVIVLSPVLTAAAGFVVAAGAKLGLTVVLGIHLTPAILAGLFATGVAALTTKILVWLHGTNKLAQIASTNQTDIAAQVTQHQMNLQMLDKKAYAARAHQDYVAEQAAPLIVHAEPGFDQEKFFERLERSLKSALTPPRYTYISAEHGFTREVPADTSGAITHEPYDEGRPAAANEELIQAGAPQISVKLANPPVAVEPPAREHALEGGLQPQDIPQPPHTVGDIHEIGSAE